MDNTPHKTSQPKQHLLRKLLLITGGCTLLLMLLSGITTLAIRSTNDANDTLNQITRYIPVANEAIKNTQTSPWELAGIGVATLIVSFLFIVVISAIQQLIRKEKP